MQNRSKIAGNGWLAFELNILRRMKFKTVIIPFTSEPNLGTYLKRTDSRVLANDFTQAGWIKAVAMIENNSEVMTEDDLNLALSEAYVPHFRLQNESLKNWFNETDSWWFDNVRQNIEQITSPAAQAIALTIGMGVGDYVLSFDNETRELRQPLSKVFKRLWSIFPEPVDNGVNNHCHNKIADEFIAENQADLMFLNLPSAHIHNLKNFLGWTAWREEWLHKNDQFWEGLERQQVGKLGDFIETKSQYLQILRETLERALHIPQWAIAHIDEGFISTQDILETISSVRKVDTVFTKDFTELIGTKAVIFTA